MTRYYPTCDARVGFSCKLSLFVRKINAEASTARFVAVSTTLAMDIVKVPHVGSRSKPDRLVST